MPDFISLFNPHYKRIISTELFDDWGTMSLENVVPMTISPLHSFPDLAAEICEMIFQFSSEPENPSRWGLSLVSRAVQQWTDPILFRHITFRARDPHMDDPMEDMERFEDWRWSIYSTKTTTPRFERALSCVRTLYINCSMGHTEVAWHMILHGFPNLVAVAVDEPWDYIDLDECDEQDEHPTLRFVYGAIAGLFSHREDCTILSNVTHVEMGCWSVSYTEDNFTHWSIFKNLLYVSFDGSGWTEAEKMMSCLPSTVLLVILIFKAEEVNDSPPDDDVIEGYAGGKYDSRLLLCWCGLEDPPPAYGPWVLKGRAEFSAMEELRQLWGSKEPTFWDRGLRIIEERKRS